MMDKMRCMKQCDKTILHFLSTIKTFIPLGILHDFVLLKTPQITYEKNIVRVYSNKRVNKQCTKAKKLKPSKAW